MKAVVAAFNQEKALVGAFSVIMNPRMEIFEALVTSVPRRDHGTSGHRPPLAQCLRLALEGNYKLQVASSHHLVNNTTTAALGLFPDTPTVSLSLVKLYI